MLSEYKYNVSDKHIQALIKLSYTRTSACPQVNKSIQMRRAKCLISSLEKEGVQKS